jgi:Tfp pilus assembly pilus retraction ATPase PilT
MTFMEFFLLLGVAGCTGLGASSVLAAMIDRIGRAPGEQES